MSPYRAPPPVPSKPKRTPWHRLVWARLRGLSDALRVRSDRNWLARAHPRASWDACQTLALARVHGSSSEVWYDLQCAWDRVGWEDRRGFCLGRRVTREEHLQWIENGEGPAT